MSSLNSIVVGSLCLLLMQFDTCYAQEIVDTWKYTLRRPAEGWQNVEFDDSNWKEGSGGFGTRSTPNARVGTTWSTNSIWLRKSFQLKKAPVRPALLIHHDEAAEVYLGDSFHVVRRELAHAFTVVLTALGRAQVQFSLFVLHHANGFSGGAEANGHFRAYGDIVEVLAEFFVDDFIEA